MNLIRFNKLAQLCGLLAICSLLAACQKQQSQNHLAKIQSAGVLKVATLESPTTYYIDQDGNPAGLEYELAQNFANHLGVKLEIVAKSAVTEILPLVESGEVDLLAAGLAVTPERQAMLRFSPAYHEVSQKVVFKQGKKWARTIDQLTGKLRVIAHSSHAEQLLALKHQYPSLRWTEATDSSVDDLLNMVLDETIDYTVIDSNELALKRRYHPELSIAFTLGDTKDIAWGLSKQDDDSLYMAVLDFFGSMQAYGQVEQLLEKYFGHVDKFDYVDTKKFIASIDKKLPRFQDTFAAAAQDDLDWRLLAAISYQESHWNPKARSSTGVRGMMMLTLNTAKEMGVNRLDVEQSITGGAEYLRKIYNKLPERIAEPDRTWMAMAAYNIGYGHLEDARIITEKRGDNPDTWTDVKKSLPLLRQKKWYKQTKYGYARGDEPVVYVDNIRRYYETLAWRDNQKQLMLAEAEKQHLEETIEKMVIVADEAIETLPTSN